MNIKRQYVPVTATGRRPRRYMKARYITVHSTANRATAQNEADNICNNSPLKQVSFHDAVDDKGVVQTIPHNEGAWHAGDGLDTGNAASIGVEICEGGDRRQTLLNAIDYIYATMMEEKIDINHIAQHNAWSGKDCPRILRNPLYIVDGMDWKWFMNLLKQKVEGKKVGVVSHWAQKYLDSLVKKGIIKSPLAHADLDKPITKGELFALIDRITDTQK